MKNETPKIFLPRTGQTTSYSAGDDGDVQAGNPRATRFVDNGNGTVTDRATGLQWVQDPTDCGEAFHTAGALVTMNWADAAANCLALEYAGFADWRLPNPLEALSLVDWSSAVTRVQLVGTGNLYWSSTSYQPDPTNKAYHYREYTAAYSCYTEWKTALRYVRPVRGGRING